MSRRNKHYVEIPAPKTPEEVLQEELKNVENTLAWNLEWAEKHRVWAKENEDRRDRLKAALRTLTEKD